MADLRDLLRKESDRIDPAPDALQRVFDGQHRRQVRRRVAATVTAGALTVAMGVWFAVAFFGNPSPDQPAGTPTAVPVAGDYRVTLPTDDPDVAALGVAGDYTLHLLPNGVIQMDVPVGFEDAHESASGDPYRVTGNIITIGSFTTFSCPGTVGTYRIVRTDTQLRLAPIDEPCELRAAIFGSEPWNVV